MLELEQLSYQRKQAQTPNILLELPDKLPNKIEGGGMGKGAFGSLGPWDRTVIYVPAWK